MPFKNENIWQVIITVLLTANIALLGFLVHKVESVEIELRVLNSRSLVNEQVIKSHIRQSERFIERELSNTYAEKEWVRNNFQEK